MANKKRNAFTYELKQGNRIVYIGKTNDLEKAEQRHLDGGKKFTKIVKTSIRMTDVSALDRETANLEKFRKSHNGKNPKYNETLNG